MFLEPVSFFETNAGNSPRSSSAISNLVAVVPLRRRRVRAKCLISCMVLVCDDVAVVAALGNSVEVVDLDGLVNVVNVCTALRELGESPGERGAGRTPILPAPAELFSRGHRSVLSIVGTSVAKRAMPPQAFVDAINWCRGGDVQVMGGCAVDWLTMDAAHLYACTRCSSGLFGCAVFDRSGVDARRAAQPGA